MTMRQAAKAKVEEVPRPSFFRHFFKNLGEGFELPTDVEDEGEDDDDDEDFDKMDMYIQDDVEYAESLRDQIIPHAVRYYTGEANPDDDEDDDEDDDDDDDDDDDEDDDDSPKQKGGKGKGKGKGQEECKQQ